MHVARILPASIRRAFSLMKERVVTVFADAPIVFFAVVLGVALTFRLGVGVVRAAASPEPTAPTFATTAPIVTGPATAPIVTGPEPGLPRGTGATVATTTAEVGAAAKVQPIGSPPKPRARGRRPAPTRGDR